MMEGARCSVESLGDFKSSSGPPKILRFGMEVLISNGTNRLFVCCCREPKVKAILEFPNPVRHLALSLDKKHLYAHCESDGIYFLSLPEQARTVLSSTSAGQHSSLTPIKVSYESCAVRNPEICTFVVVENVLVTVGQGETVWRFSFYEVPEGSAACHRKLGERCLPVVSSGPNGATAHWSPVLCCVFAHGAVAELLGGLGHFVLELALFILLFGIDSSLVSTPVILCGLPDGRLCCLPFPQLGRTGAVDLCSGGVRVLHSLEQPVAFIGTSDAEDAASAPRALVVVGHMGKVLLVRAEEGEEGRAAGFRERSVPGPMGGCCVSGTHLYYSTCSDLLALRLCPDTPLALSSEEGRGLNPAPIYWNPVSLNVCMVLALAEPAHNSAGAVELMAFTHRGRLLRITLPQRSDQGQPSKLSSAQAGQRVRDLLADIGSMSERASLLKDRIKLKNEALKNLNHVFNVCCLQLSNQNGSKGQAVDKKPISFRVRTRWIRLLQQNTLAPSCFLENSSSYVLEQGWALSVQVINPSNALTQAGEGSTTTYSFPLQKLIPGKNLEVNLPLGSTTQLFLPLKVCCTLIYSLQSMLGADEVGFPRSIQEAGCISLPLGTVMVDWLDCLEIVGPEHQENRSMLDSSADVIQAFLSSRRVERQSRITGGLMAGALEGGPYSASITVSAELLKAALKGPVSGAPSLGISLLSWLVSGCPDAGVRVGMDCPAVHTRYPGGGSLRVVAKEVMLTDMCIGGPVSAVELRMESSSAALLCGLHHAVLRRVKTLLMEAPTNTEAPTQVQGLSLGRFLELTEAVSREIQDARGFAALGAAASRRTTEKLLCIYQQLRDNPLLLI